MANRNRGMVGLILSLSIILFAALSLVFVGKITQIGGESYQWEYIPPSLSLILGVLLFAYWFRQAQPLRPGKCECGHSRCMHVKGVGDCRVSYGVSEKFPKGSSCACELFITIDAWPEESTEDKETRELRRIAGLKS